MRVIIDYDIHPLAAPSMQAVVNDDGDMVDPSLLLNKILVDSFVDEFGRVVLVFTEHSFEDQS